MFPEIARKRKRLAISPAVSRESFLNGYRCPPPPPPCPPPPPPPPPWNPPPPPCHRGSRHRRPCYHRGSRHRRHATAVVATRCATRERVSTACITGRAMVKAVTSASVADSTAVAYATAIASPTVVPAAAIVSAPAIVPTATPITVIPGAGADEEATDKPARPIVAIGRASIRVIVVIAPRTHRRGVPVTVIPVSRQRRRRYPRRSGH